MDNPIDLGELSNLLSLMVIKGATDLFITVGVEPTVIVDGNYYRASDEVITQAKINDIVDSVLSEKQSQTFKQELALDFGVEFPGVGRCRLNFYHQKGAPAIVARFISNKIPDFETLGIPSALQKVMREKRGLVLVVGAAGSGKSTTLASMLDYRNSHHSGHILTIEDPIEYTHSHKMCLVSQREVGIDTKSYEDALKHALRETPDTILIGEIRDAETAKYALRFAETGHLCISSMHANNATQAIDRFLNLFSESEHQRIRHDLSQHLLVIVAQRFANSVKNHRILVSEVMMNNHFIASLIEKGEMSKVKTAMSESDNDSQIFDDVLNKLVSDKKISRDEALRIADSKINLSLALESEDSNILGVDYEPMDYKQGRDKVN
ncbi:MAG: PilT/PilU family type 4a pilus ATPase [Cellvibrionaceae bacterium]